MNQPKVQQPGVSIIIVVGRPSRQLRYLLQEAKRIATRTEVIVVCSPDDASTPALVNRKGGTVAYVDPACSVAEKRVLGASQAAGNILLFLEDSVCLPTKLLKRYITSIKKGYDIVLSVYTKRKPTSHSVAFQLLNHVSGRKFLGTGSMCEIPFSINRLAWDALEFARFSPPMAQARAVLQGFSFGAIRLHIRPPKPGPVSSIQRLELAAEPSSPVTEDLVLQEHAKAISHLLQKKGERGGLWDGNRYRPLLQVPGRFHFRSVYRTYRDAWKMEQGGGWGEKRKAKRTYSRKKR